jgi:hypothetical protein
MWVVQSSTGCGFMYEEKLFPYHLYNPNSIMQLDCDRLPECFAESPRTHAISSGHFGSCTAFHLQGREYNIAQNNSYWSSINVRQAFEIPLHDYKVGGWYVITAIQIQ